MKDNAYGIFFRVIRRMVRIFYPKYTVQIQKDFANDVPVVYVSHHQNLFGPFVILLWFPKCLHTWMLHVFLDRKACYKQYVDYTFTKRYGWNTLLAKLVAFPISYFITRLLNSGKGIPVYRGSRKIVQTFNQSVAALSRGEDIVIFPDTDYSDKSSSIKNMYEGFLYLEKYYHKATGKHVCFMPLYVSKNKRLIISGEPLVFRNGEDFNKERKIVNEKIMANLNKLAVNCDDI